MTTANQTMTNKEAVKSVINLTVRLVKGLIAVGVEVAPLVESTVYLVAGGVRILKEELSLQDINNVEAAVKVIRNWLEDSEETKEAEDLATQTAELEAKLAELKSQAK